MIRLLLISLVGLISCSPKLASQKIVINDTEMLFGNITKTQLYYDFPEWGEEEQFYQPIQNIIGQINNYKHEVNVIIFLGTWCGDSRNNVPAFFKTVGQNKNISYKIWAVDRQKKLENNLPEQYNIERVPTFVFEIDGQEIGRIVENPQNSMEEDVLEILSRNSRK
jgi:hypothetical protein